MQGPLINSNDYSNNCGVRKKKIKPDDCFTDYRPKMTSLHKNLRQKGFEFNQN